MILIWYYLRANRVYQSKGIISDALSVVWTQRYQDYGEAEIVLPLGYDIALDDVLAIPDRDMVVIVTGTTETEEALTIRAKDILSVLDRRIVYPTVHNNGNISTFVDKLLRNDSIILDSGNNIRTLQPFRVGDLTAITGTADIQRSYGQLGETLLNLSRTYGFNLKAILDDGLIYITAENTHASRVWGVGRYLSGYKIDKDAESYKNTAYVGGQIVQGAREVSIYPQENSSTSARNLKRYETFVDKRDLPYTDMSREAIESTYGDVSATGGLSLYTVTEGNSSPYTVKDFIAYGTVMLSGVTPISFSIDSLKDALGDISTLLAHADTSVDSRPYTGVVSGDNYAVDMDGYTVNIPIQDVLDAGIYSMDVSQYDLFLFREGESNISQSQPINLIEVAVEGLTPYTDYDVGDTVTIISGTGVNYNGIVKEIIESWDETGYQVTPTIDFE